ncbi:hypothetical protein H5410_016864 [Solanum commersonii]|uniref:Uncharacterized protein n=1 Tax=Solanum commersonii TaxID=4109 RepID=A0A9J5ZXS4_SOLCO|nr:hypothetical protein H5410_016864 [Solanum commersonii]
MNGQSHVRFMQAPCHNGVVESHGETLRLRKDTRMINLICEKTDSNSKNLTTTYLQTRILKETQKSQFHFCLQRPTEKQKQDKLGTKNEITCSGNQNKWRREKYKQREIRTSFLKLKNLVKLEGKKVTGKTPPPFLNV